MLKTLFLSLMLLVGMGTIAQAAAPVKFVVAHDATWPPMEYMDKNRQIVGYSVDYIDAVAKEAGFAVEHKSVVWDGIFAGLAAKKYDIISSSVTITAERAKTMDFSEPYYEVRQALVVPKDTNVTKIEDMKGKALGSQIGTTGYMATRNVPGVKAKSYDEIGMAMAALGAGRIDGVVCDDSTAKNFILDNEEYAKTMKLALILPAENPEYYGFAVEKGNTKTLELLNKGIAAVKAKGIDKELRKKWIGE